MSLVPRRRVQDESQRRHLVVSALPVDGPREVLHRGCAEVRRDRARHRHDLERGPSRDRVLPTSRASAASARAATEHAGAGGALVVFWPDSSLTTLGPCCNLDMRPVSPPARARPSWIPGQLGVGGVAKYPTMLTI